MRKISLILCAAICAGLLSSCGNNDRGDGAGHMYDVTLLGNPKSLDPQFADDASSSTVIKNMYSGLMMTDSSGNIICCNAESYEVSEDALVYTFRLRQDNYWFFDENNDDYIDDDEYFPVIAEDYVFALQRVLDPKMQSPYASDFSCIKNGGAILSGAMATDSAGVVALDEFTLEITLEYPSAEFLELMTTAAAYPCSREFFESTKGRYGLDDRSVMSNGAFYVRQWFYDPYGNNNILYMRKNSVNENEKYIVYPSYVSFSIQETEEDIKQLFKAEETECFTSLRSSGYNPKKYSISSFGATTLGFVFNSDDKIYSNLNLRKALAFSIDREELDRRIDSDVQAAYGIIPPAIDLMGRSYRELSSDKQFDIYDTQAAADCLAKAKNELNMQSIESTKILVCSNTVDSSYLHILTQKWQELLGLYLGIEDVTEEEFYKRVESGDYKIALYPVKAGYSSGLSVIDKFESVECLKSAAGETGYSDQIRRCPSAPELVEAYSAAERGILENYGFVPLFYKNSYLIADTDNEDIMYDPFTGALDFRIAKNYS